MVCFVFCDFYYSDLGIPFYGTQQYSSISLITSVVGSGLFLLRISLMYFAYVGTSFLRYLVVVVDLLLQRGSLLLSLLVALVLFASLLDVGDLWWISLL